MVCTLVAIGILAGQFVASMLLEEGAECGANRTLRARLGYRRPVHGFRADHGRAARDARERVAQALVSTDCVADPTGCLIVLASGNEPIIELPEKAVGTSMHPEPLSCGCAVLDTLSVIECTPARPYDLIDRERRSFGGVRLKRTRLAAA